MSWSFDGRSVVLLQFTPETRSDIAVLSLDDRTVTPYLQTRAQEMFGALSPDNRWMAYLSDESGRLEAYVQSYPTPGRKARVSTNGAGYVWWRRDGRQLLFANSDVTELSLADVTTDPELTIGAPRVVGRLPKGVFSIDATPDLDRVLTLIGDGLAMRPSITVVQHWAPPTGQ
jgi:Tol biopolymer transport system component